MLVHRNVDTGDTRHLFLPYADNSSAREKARKFIQKTPRDQFISHIGSHDVGAQPWRCLCLGSEAQMTYTMPRRRTILQFLQIFLTEGRTFISYSRCPAGWPFSSGPHSGATSNAIASGRRNP